MYIVSAREPPDMTVVMMMLLKKLTDPAVEERAPESHRRVRILASL